MSHRVLGSWGCLLVGLCLTVAASLGALHASSKYDRVMNELAICRDVLEKSEQGIAIFTLDGEILYRNPAAAKITGWKTDDLRKLGGPAHVYKHPEQWQEVIGAVRTGQGWQGTVTIYGHDGVERVLDAQLLTIRDAQGRPTAYMELRRRHDHTASIP